MLKNAFFIFLLTVVCWGSYQVSYPSDTPYDLYYDGIFLENVINHVDTMTQGPRAVGDFYHDDVQRYIIKQLNQIGMKVVKHNSTAFNPKNKSAAPITNIIASYPGYDENAKTLLLLSHYDAAKFSARGAADDASGVATILETLRTFKQRNKQPTNNIVALFTDAEEIGLLGAQAFIIEQLKNYDIGLVINLEARGSSGPVVMWPETVGGNRNMIEAFRAADVPLPNGTSLDYEIYKMLPNDTDLTPFVQMAGINGFNFAFIDNHFNYHTQLDSLQNLSINTLAHQTLQMNSMLKHFAFVDLNSLNSDESLVYFTIPALGLISYPNIVTWLILITSGLIFIITLVVAHKKQLLQYKTIVTGLPLLITAAVLTFGCSWLSLFLIDLIIPEFKDILQGFPYQGHHIMLALLVASTILVFAVFGFIKKYNNPINFGVIPITVWFILMVTLSHKYPGMGLLVWPLALGILAFALQCMAPKIGEYMIPFLALLSFIILGSLIVNLPIALGIQAIPITAVFITLILSLFIQISSPTKRIRYVIAALLIPFGYLSFYLINHHTFTATHPHPTSITYLYDTDSKQSYFFNYDEPNTGWNDELFKQSVTDETIKNFKQNYKKPVKQLVNNKQTITTDAIKIEATIPLQQDKDSRQKIVIDIKAYSNTELLEIYTQQGLTLYSLSINGRNAPIEKALNVAKGGRLLQYYFNKNKHITLQLETNINETLNWQVQTHSLDLLERKEFKLEQRPDNQTPKPFIKTDNIITVQSFTFGFD